MGKYVKYRTYKLIDDKGTDKKIQSETINDDPIRHLGQHWKEKFQDYSSSNHSHFDSNIQSPRFPDAEHKSEKHKNYLVEGDDRNYLHSTMNNK